MSATDIHSGLTAERLREVLSYDPETGVLRWRMARRGVGVGMVAGNKKPDGYIRIGVDYRMYKAHRLAWLHFYGRWPVSEIDHINGVRDDNRMANLRDVSRQVNGQNQRKARHMAVPSPFNTGLLGTHFDLKRQLFVAQINDPGTGKKKHLGAYTTAAEAHAAYLKEKRKIHEGNTL